MAIEPINNLLNQNAEKVAGQTGDKNFIADFGNMLQNELNKVDGQQFKAEESMKGLFTGEVKDLHQVLIAMEEAGLSMQYTLEVRNRLLEAFQEIMRMQV